MKKKGISLIVLIITIVVIIILATVIIINLANTNIIGKANEAVVKSRIKNIEEAINLWKMEQLLDNVSNNSDVKTLEDLLDDLENQKSITTEEREIIESTGKVEIGSSIIEFAKIHEISTKEDLENFRDNVDNGNTYKNEIVRLTSDINLQGNAEDSSTWWDPIGSADKDINFEGIFDGNGFSVSGMYNEESGNIEFTAFFGKIHNATVKNLTVNGTSIAGEYVSDDNNSGAAGIIGQATGKCEVANCINEVNVKKCQLEKRQQELLDVLGIPKNIQLM